MTNIPAFQTEEEARGVCPLKWTVMRVEDAIHKLPAGRIWERKELSSAGRTPVLDQSVGGVIGFHNEEPGVEASAQSPVVTFANHTCAMRRIFTPFSVIQNVFPLVGRADKCETTFLYYWLNGRVHFEEYKGHFPDLRRLWLPLPPLDEQRAIAGVLGALDDKIESNRRVWALASSLVRSEYEASIRDGESKFCNLADISRFNVSTRKPGSPSEPISYIDISSVESGTVTGVQQLTWADAPSRARRGVSDGDIIFSTVRPARMAYSAMINPTSETVVSTGFAVMSPRKVPMTLLLALVSHTDFGNFCESVSQGSAYPAVSPEAMGTYPVEIPTADVLEQFGERTVPVLRRAHSGTLENRTLTSLRDALIPELLSGQLRVRDAEKIVEEVV